MKTEYVSIMNWNIKVITKEEALSNTKDNIYYLHWVREDLEYKNWNRAKDEDIEAKDFFVLDLDIRANYIEQTWEDCSNEDIISIWKDIWEFLKEENEYFWEWSKIVYTWNWLHIYYEWEVTSFDKVEYSNWVNRIYREWDKYMWDNVYNCDKACRNIARILRLPWTINQKNWAKVEILAEEKIQSRLFWLIKSFAKKELEDQKVQEEKRQEKIQARLKEFSTKDNWFYQTINSIPAYEIAQNLLPEFPYDWKKNFKNKVWGFTWYFYNKETNTICNWGSRYFNWGWIDSCWDNFSIIKYHYNYTNKETFNFYKKALWIN